MADFSGYGMPAVNFAPLANLGTIYQQSKQRAARDAALSAIQKGTPLSDISRALFQAGDVEGGLGVARLVEAQAQHGASQQARQDALAIQREQMAQNQRQFEETKKQQREFKDQPQLITKKYEDPETGEVTESFYEYRPSTGLRPLGRAPTDMQPIPGANTPAPAPGPQSALPTESQVAAAGPEEDISIPEAAKPIQFVGNEPAPGEGVRQRAPTIPAGAQAKKFRETYGKEQAENLAGKPKAEQTMLQITDQFDRMKSLATDLRNDPVLQNTFRNPVGAASYIPNFRGSASSDWRAKFDTLKDQASLTAMQALKELSKTGATGLGNLSNAEGIRLENAQAALKEAQSPKEVMKALNDIVNFVDTSKKRMYDAYEGTYVRPFLKQYKNPEDIGVAVQKRLLQPGDQFIDGNGTIRMVPK